MKKAALRAYYKQERKAISQEAKLTMEQKMVEHFRNLSLPEINYFLSYQPIEKFNEPSVCGIADYLHKTFPNSTQCMPRVIENAHTFDAISVQESSSFGTSKLGILEPQIGEIIPPTLIDLILIPLLIFDTKGFRVGYGKGMYDNFLQTCRPDVLKIGISLFEPIAAIEDVFELDVPMDFCISPEKIHHF